MTVKTIAASYSHQRAFWYLTYALIALGFLYIYLVNAIVMGVVTRERLRDTASALQTEVTSLESRYVGLSGTVTLDLARNLGYKDAAAGDSSFAYRSQSGVALSYRSH